MMRAPWCLAFTGRQSGRSAACRFVRRKFAERPRAPLRSARRDPDGTNLARRRSRAKRRRARRGWSRQDVRVRTKVEGYADAASRARALVSAVRVTTAAGRLRTDGPMAPDNEHWATRFISMCRRTCSLRSTRTTGASLSRSSAALPFFARRTAASGCATVSGRYPRPHAKWRASYRARRPSLGRTGSRCRDAKRIRPSRRCPSTIRQNSKRERCTAASRSTFPRQSIQAASAGSPQRWDREGRRFARSRPTGRWSCGVQ